MGGTKPSAPQVIMPAPTSPTVFQTTVPLKSYKDLAAQLGRFETELGKIQGQRYQEVGTPAEIGAAQQARNVKSEEAYLASLPRGDRYLAQTTGAMGFPSVQGSPESGIRPGTTALSLAQSLSAKALERIGEVPAPTISETPEWAQGTLQYKKIIDGDKTTYEEIPGPYSSIVETVDKGAESGSDRTESGGGSSKKSSKGFLGGYIKGALTGRNRETA
jgi:hypothetical protein